MDCNLKDMIETLIRKEASYRVDKLITEETERFERQLKEQKEELISDIVRHIRIRMDENVEDAVIEYRIIVENR